MLRFDVYTDGRAARHVHLEGAYLVGTEGVPVRADIDFSEGQVTCHKRTAGAAALVLLWRIEGVGVVVQETARLQERDKPYNLQRELARGRLMRIEQKREDWGLYDYSGAEAINTEIDRARDRLIDAFKADSPAETSRLGDEALRGAVTASEALSMYHADIFLKRRQQAGSFGRNMFGCTLNIQNTSEVYRKHLLENFDFVTLPTSWRTIEPKEQEYDWRALDAWVDFLSKRRIPIQAGPLVAFDELNLPDWLYIWEHDFDTVREMVQAHMTRVVQRYGSAVQSWRAVSGLHANNAFNFGFEQLMELTRLAVATLKQLAPRAVSMIDIVEPWGEYYARNQRTIPPMLYADLVVQSGINFDAFGLQFSFGKTADGMFARDMFQISSAIDRFSNLGKPLHITTVQVPSSVLPPEPPADEPLPVGCMSGGGMWRGEWSEAIQAEWLKSFYMIALSKPFVESVNWRDLIDPPPSRPGALPTAGLIRADGAPKPACEMHRAIRAHVYGREAMPV